MLVQLTGPQPFGPDHGDLSEQKNFDRPSAARSRANAKDRLPEAPPSVVAFFAARALLEEKERRVASEACQRTVDDVSGVYQAGIGVPDRPFRLKPLGSKPSVHEAEAPAAMVVLVVVDSLGQAVHENRIVLGPTVSDTCEKFCEMDRRVGLVPDRYEQDTGVPLEDASDWAGDAMRRECDRI